MKRIFRAMSPTVRWITLGCLLLSLALLIVVFKPAWEAEAPKHKPIESALDLRRGGEEEALSPQAQSQADAGEEEDSSPFSQARQMQEEMEEEMKQAFAGPGIAGSAFGDSQKIVAKEDEKSVTYEISGVVGSSLNTSVQNGYLTISGETKSQTAHSSFSSSFQQMFPLPGNVDSTKMETTSEKDKVVLRFPKRHG